MQFESMDLDLLTGLWNGFQLHFWKHVKPTLAGDAATSELEEVVRKAWVHFFKWPLTDMNWSWETNERRMREHFTTHNWFKMYDFVEFMLPCADCLECGNERSFTLFCNEMLEKENSTWRIVNKIVVPLTTEHEIGAVESAINSPYEPVGIQISCALKKLSDKTNPDYRGSIKESISAVEFVVKLIGDNDKATLSSILSKVKKNVGLNDRLEQGLLSIYAWTNDEKGGIRHAMMQNKELSPADARFMLVACSAFANYLIQLGERSGMLKPN